MKCASQSSVPSLIQLPQRQGRRVFFKQNTRKNFAASLDIALMVQLNCIIRGRLEPINNFVYL